MLDCEQPSVLFDRATTWMLAHKVFLPGCTTLERFVARLRSRVQNRLWKLLGHGITDEQRTRLEDLLTVPPQGRSSWLDKLRSGPVHISSRSLVLAIRRLQVVRDLNIKLPATGVSSSRLASLARFAGTAKVTAIGRLPPVRRLATWVAFVHCLEATAQDDAIEVLDMLLHELFSNAAKADKKTRLRSLKDLDQAAIAWRGMYSMANVVNCVNATGKVRKISWEPLGWWLTSLCCGTRSISMPC